jgi:type IV secretory pathway VirB4 component
MSKTKIRKLSTLSEYQTAHALAHELPYWDFNDGVATLADGSLVKSYRLKGKAIETLDTDAINQLNQDIRAFLSGLPDNTELSLVVDVNSDYRDLIQKHGAFAAPGTDVGWVADSRVKQLNESLDQLELLKQDLYLFIYQRPENETESEKKGLLSKFFEPAKTFQQFSLDVFEKRLHNLLQHAEAILQGLTTIGIECAGVANDDLIRLIYKYLNPKRSRTNTAPKISQDHRGQEFSPEELALAPELSLPSPREQLLFSDLVLDYDCFFLDGVYHRVVTLKTLPEFTHSALVTNLLQLPFHYTLSCHLKTPVQSKELATLQSKRRMAHSMSISHGGRAADLESEAQLNATEDLLREIINTGQKILYTQISILIRAETRDELDLKTRAVLSKFREMNGAEGLAETVAGFPAWKTTLPAGVTNLLRPRRIKTDNLSDFLPIYQDYTGEGVQPVCLFQNRSGSLVAYDPFDGSKLPSYNALVTGSSGAGKSFLNNLVLLQYMTQKPLVYIIDIGGSYRKLCEFLGGQYVEISPPKEGAVATTVNPMLLPEGESKPSPQKLKFLLAMLESVLTDNEGDKLPKLDKSLLEEALIHIYDRVAGKRSPTLSDLAAHLASSKEPTLNAFAKMLFPWTGNRPYGLLLDRQGSLDLKSDVVVFDLKSLSAYPDLQSVMILIITDFILGRVEAKGEFQGRRKQILMDECWALLNGPASSFMEYCVRTLRKSGSGITFITQGLDEIVASPIGGAILANTPIKFILLQRGDMEPIRKTLKLNDQEVALISSLRQRKGAYSEAFLIYNEDRSVIRAVPTPIEYWLATSDATDNSKIEEERRDHPQKTLRQVIEEFSEKYPFGYANYQRERGAA